MTLIEQLAKLAELAPDVCQIISPEGDTFGIGDYGFWVDDEGIFTACHKDYPNDVFIKDQPALAWLQDALQRAIETRGWYFEINKYPKELAHVYITSSSTHRGAADTTAEALLDALIRAVAK